MPIIIAREGPVEPKITTPLTKQQTQEIWESIVRNWCDKHPDRLRELMEPASVKA